MSHTIKLRTVFGGTATLERERLSRVLLRKRSFISTIAGSIYHIDNFIIPEQVKQDLEKASKV